MSVVLENLRSRTLGVLLLPALSLIAPPASSIEIPAAQKQSDYELMSPQTRAIQDDDSVNPGMFWVLDGEEQWGRKDGSSNLSCADCHTTESMRGVAALIDPRPARRCSRPFLVSLDNARQFGSFRIWLGFAA